MSHPTDNALDGGPAYAYAEAKQAIYSLLASEAVTITSPGVPGCLKYIPLSVVKEVFGVRDGS